MKSVASISAKPALLIMGLSATALLAGCQPPPPPPPPPPPVVWHVPSSRPEQVSQLQAESKRLDREVSDLPGNTRTEHRDTMAKALRSLRRSIALAAGSNPSPHIQDQIAGIDQSREVVKNTSLSNRRVAAAENQAIYSGLGALQQLASRPAVPVPGVESALADAQKRLSSLQVTQGPLHELDVTQTMSSLANAVRLLAEQYGGNTPMANAR